MKRFIAVLLVMGVIMTAFAATGSLGMVSVSSSSSTTAAQTDVTLDLNQNLAVVWFSKNNDTTTSYKLDLPDNLTASTTSWVAKGNDLYLNWNIVSKNKVKVELTISDPMKSGSDAIGWNVSFTTLSTDGSEDGSSATTLTKESTEGRSDKTGVAYKKNGSAYGDNGSVPIYISTENVYGKTIGYYTATITATVITY